MRDIYKQPIFYYTAIAVAAALWPALMWGVYLPGARKNLANDQASYAKAQETIGELLSLDPDRLNYADAKGTKAEFDYATAVQTTADFCKIPAAGYKLSSSIIVTTSGQKSQSATVTLKEVDIAKFAKFLSTIQLRWTNLQCTKVTLKKRKGLPDSWDIDLTFRYYY